MEQLLLCFGVIAISTLLISVGAAKKNSNNSYSSFSKDNLGHTSK